MSAHSSGLYGSLSIKILMYGSHTTSNQWDRLKRACAHTNALNAQRVGSQNRPRAAQKRLLVNFLFIFFFYTIPSCGARLPLSGHQGAIHTKGTGSGPLVV